MQQVSLMTLLSKNPEVVVFTMDDAKNNSVKTTRTARTAPTSMLNGTSDESGVAEPHKHDVLSGRGNFVNYHNGNEHFRMLVQKYKVAYVNCPKSQKGKFSQLIVDEIHAQNPPGRFLKQDPKTKLWNDIEEKKAFDKTRQALRGGAPELLKEINHSNCSQKTENAAVQEKNCFNTSHQPLPVELPPSVNRPHNVREEFSDINQRVIPNAVSLPQQHQFHSSKIAVEDSMDPYREAAKAILVQRRSECIKIFDPLEAFPNSVPNQRLSFVEPNNCFSKTPIQRDDSIQLDNVFSKNVDINGWLTTGSSAMTCSIGDITEASLSKVFEDSMRISDIEKPVPLKKTNSSKEGDSTTFSITDPNMSLCGSSVFEDTLSTLNFED